MSFSTVFMLSLKRMNGRILVKIKEGFILRKIADTDVVVPIGNNIADFNGIISLNGSAALLWQYLKDGSQLPQLVEVLVDTYDIDRDTAQVDIEHFVDQLQQADMFEQIV